MLAAWLRDAGLWLEPAGRPISRAAYEARLEARRAEVRGGLVAKPLAALNFVVFYRGLHHIAPDAERIAWGLAAGPIVTAWLGFSAALFVLRPPEDRFYRIWAPVGRLLTLAVVAVTAATAWFLQYADVTGNLYLVALYLGFFALMAAAVSEGPGRVVLAIAMIGGAAGLQLALLERWHLSGMLVAAGVVMAAIALSQGRSFRRLVAAREATEALALQLDLALTARGRFMAAVSHDLRQPLAAIRLYLDQLLKGGAGPGAARALSGARQALESTDALLSEMLQHLQLAGGATPVRPAAVHLAELLTRVAAVHEPAAAEAGMRLKVVSSSLCVQADAHLAERAIGNLVVNAVRHAMGERIVLGVRRRGGLARVYVIDDGVGVPPEDGDRLFEDYTQGSRHRPELRGGFGLGLASARRMAELMGGAADLDGRWRSGAAFYLQLPLAKPGG